MSKKTEFEIPFDEPKGFNKISEDKKKSLRDALGLDKPDYQEYKESKKKKQKRREFMYKVTSLGSSGNMVRNLIVANILIYIVTFYFARSTFDYLAIFPLKSGQFAIWQPVTSMFLHGGLLHILFNMICLWSFGNALERVLGSKKFLILYFVSGLIGSALWMFLGTGPAVGASGAICGLFAAFLFVAPESKVLLFFLIPMKLKYAVYGFAAISLIFGVMSLFNPSAGGGVGHFAHLGGMIGGYLIGYYWRAKNLIPTY